MRIAYITSEYPPDIGQGGIATYTLQVAQMMQKRGHDVEVFSGSFERNLSEIYLGLLTHRILITGVKEFKDKVIQIFSERNSFEKFEIIECAEIGGDAYEINKRYPEIPLIIKLHTPGVLITKVANTFVPFKIKLRFVLGAVKRGKIDLGYWSWYDKNQESDIDYKITQKATIIVSPSQALRRWAIRFWNIKKDRIVVIPNPYIPSDSYLNILSDKNHNRISFIGKLNVLKGMVTLTEVMKIVLERNRQICFRLVGPDQPSHVPGLSFKQYIQSNLGNLIEQVEFTGSVDLDKIPIYLSDTDICIFPSLWENFPTVCLEAMSAGKAIIASNKGGFKEMIKDKVSGYLIHPKKTREMAKSIINLIENDQLRYNFGIEARKTVLKNFNAEIIGKKIEKVYKNAIILKSNRVNL